LNEWLFAENTAVKASVGRLGYHTKEAQPNDTGPGKNRFPFGWELCFFFASSEDF